MVANIFGAIATELAKLLGAKAFRVTGENDLPGHRPGCKRNTPPHFVFVDAVMSVYKYKASKTFELADPVFEDDVKAYVGNVPIITYDYPE